MKNFSLLHSRVGSIVQRLVLILCVLTFAVSNVWADPTTIYSNTGATGESGGVTTSGNINANNGNSAPSFGLTSANKATITITGLSLSSYSNISLTLDYKLARNGSNYSSLTVTQYNSNNTSISTSNISKSDQSWHTSSAISINTACAKITIVCNPAGSTYNTYVDNITITGTASTPSCDKSLSLTKSVSGNGSFNVYQGSVSNSNQIAFTSNAASIDNCGSGTTTLVVVPQASEHYHISSVEATNKKAQTNITVSNGQYSIQYAQGSNVTSQITVTFAEDDHSSIVLNDANGDGSAITNKYVGENYTLPTTAASCTGKTFVGWSTVTVSKTDTKPTSNFYEPGATYENLPASIKFYAVYAKQTAFTRVTNVSQLANGQSIVVVDDANSKALTTSVGYAVAPVEAQDGTITPSANMIWTLESSSTNWKLKTGNSYLGATSVSNNSDDASLTSNNSTWTIEASSATGVENCFYFKNTQGTNKCLEYYSSYTKWTVYKNTNYATSVYFTERLYVSTRSAYATGCAACDENPTVGAAGLKSEGEYGLDGVEVSVSGMSTGSDACEWTDYGFYWGTSANKKANKKQVGTSGDATSYEATLAFEAPAQLATGTTYYFCAYGKNSKSGAAIVYGTEASFTPYTVSYNNNGGSGTITTQVVNTGGSVTLPSSGFTKQGHHIDHWALNNTSGASHSKGATYSNITANAEFYAIWAANPHTLTWSWNNGSCSATAGTGYTEGGTVNYGSKIDYPSNESMNRTGYNFNGWSSSPSGNPATMPDQDLTITAQWQTIPYTITYNTNGGDAIAAGSYTIESNTYNLPTPTKTGYTFVGWKANSGLTGDNVTSIAKGSTGNKEYWAAWTANTYEVVFHKNGGQGSDMQNQSFTYDEAAKALSTNTYTPAADSHKYFYGWNTNQTQATAGNRQYEPGESVQNLTSAANGTVTLYAVWKDHTYTNFRTRCCTAWDDPELGWSSYSLSAGGDYATKSLSGDTHGTLSFESSNPSVITVDADGKVTPVGAGTAHVTATWVDGDEVYCEKVMVSDDFTVTGKVVVTFKKNDGSETADKTQEITASSTTNLTLLSTLGFTAPSCKQFVGWNINKDATTATYTDGAEVTLSEGITLYAIWADITYDITKGTNTGAATFTVASSVTCGQDLTITCAADDYHEGNPTVTADGTHGDITVVSATEVTIENVQSDMTVTISYAAKVTHALKFMNFEDGEYKATSTKNLYAGAAYGELPTLASDKACDGTSTTFKGWTTSKIDIKTGTEPTYISAETVMGSEDVEVYAVWAKQTGHEGYDLVTSPTSGKKYIFVSSNTAGSAYAVAATSVSTSTSSGTKAASAAVTISSGTPVCISTVNTNLEFAYDGADFEIVGTLASETTKKYLHINGSYVGRRTASDANIMWDSDKGLYGQNGNKDKNYYLYLNSTEFDKAETPAGNARVYAFEKQEVSYKDYVTSCITSAVTIATLTNGSTITVKNGNASVANGDEIAPGVALTITTEAASGYRVDNLRAYKTGDTNTPVAIENGVLTMPAYPITITAEETAVYPVSVAVADGQSTWGSVTIDGVAGPVYVNEDDNPEIVAAANAGYRFKEWTVTGGAYDLGEKALTDASIAPQVSAEATFTATFEEKPMTGLTLSQDALTVDLASGTASLSVTGYTPSDLLDAKKTIAWSSSDETVATVSNGTITLKKNGTATITAAWTEDESIYASCALNVYKWSFTGYTVTTAPKISYYKVEKFSTAGVEIEKNYERSDDNTKTNQETYEGAWTAKLDGETIEDGDDLAIGTHTLKLYVGDEEIASYTLTVSSDDVDLFEVGIWDIDAPTFQAGTYTMPSLSNQTAGAAATCHDHNLFVGWTTDPDDPKAENITAGGTEGIVASNTTYYAVWAKNGTITDDVEKNTIGGTETSATLNAAISYSTGQGGGTTAVGVNDNEIRLYQNSAGGYGGYILFTASTGYKIKAITLTTSTGSEFGYELQSTFESSQMTPGTISNHTIQLTNLTATYVIIAAKGSNKSDRLNISAMSVTYETTGPTDYIVDCEARYEIRFDANGGIGSYDPIKKAADKTIELPSGSLLSKEYHNFAGWKIGATPYEAGDTYTVAGADAVENIITVTAQWTPFSQGAVTVDGETLEGSPFYATQSYTLPTPDAISGKKFIGWSDGEHIVAPGEYAMPDPADAITYTSQWFDLLPTPSSVSFTDGEWILVTAQDQLHAGDFVVVAAANADYAMGAEASGGNNRTPQAVTKSGNTLSYTSDVQPLFLQNGYGANQYALYDMSADKYLYAASSSSNNLKIDNDFDQNGSWLITIANGSTSVMAQGANTHNDLRYNAGNSVANSVFSCYLEGGQQPIALYRWIKTIKTEGTVDASDVMPTYNVNLVVQTNTAIDMNVERTVNDFIIEAMEGHSGQITHPEKLNINGNAYYDLTLNTTGTMDNTKWYAFAVPFQVDAATGIQRLSNDGVASPAQFNGHYVLLKYNSGLRASSGNGWEYVTAGEKLTPGNFYMVALNSNAYNRLRMTKDAGNLNNKADLTLATTSGSAANKNWNALANNALSYANVSATGDNATCKVQTYISNEDKYDVFTYGEVTFTVGTPFFIQVAASGTMNVVTGETEHSELRAPQREALATEEFIVRLGENTTSYYDKLYVSASDEALNEYQIGHDLAKAGVSTKVPQMYVPAYGTQLCDAEFPLINNEARFPLTFTTPNAGTYQLYVAVAAQDAELYLLQNDNVIWDLTLSPYALTLPQGTTEGYGLLLKAKAPNAATGVDEINAEVGAQKVIIDEHVYILRGRQMYDVNGKMVK